MNFPRRTLTDTLAFASDEIRSRPGPLSKRLAFVDHRARLRRFVGASGTPLDCILDRLEEAERDARRRRPCLDLGGRI